MSPSLHDVIRPFTKTGSYYARSWRDYLGGAGSPQLPIARPSLALAAQALRDEVVLLGLRARRPLSQPRAFAHIHDEVVAALEFYGALGCLRDPGGFFATPSSLSAVEIAPVHRGGGRFYARMRWPSDYTPRVGEPGGADRWRSYGAVGNGYALLLRHRDERPWLVCVHGTEMGRAALDLALFRAWYLHDELGGLNVVLPVLPLHGPRATGLPKSAVFPPARTCSTMCTRPHRRSGISAACWPGSGKSIRRRPSESMVCPWVVSSRRWWQASTTI